MAVTFMKSMFDNQSMLSTIEEQLGSLFLPGLKYFVAPKSILIYLQMEYRYHTGKARKSVLKIFWRRRSSKFLFVVVILKGIIQLR